MASCVIIYSGVSYHDATSKAGIKGALCSCFVFVFFLEESQYGVIIQTQIFISSTE